MAKSVPTGYLFSPTDEQLLRDYLWKKSIGLPPPCDVVIDLELYRVGDKAPWQIFTDQDQWEICKTEDDKNNITKTEGTIYVFTTSIKAGKDRKARTAGCGTWHGETSQKDVLDDNGSVIGKLWSGELPTDRESDSFSQLFTGFHATEEPLP